jgi:subtilisin family serine protease
MHKHASLGSLLVMLTLAASPALLGQSAAAQHAKRPQFVPQQLLVKFKAGTPDSIRAQIHRGVGASVLRRFNADPRLEHVRIPAGEDLDSAMAYYSTRADVQYVQKDFIYHVVDNVPNDPGFGQQWAWKNTLTGANPLASVNATEAWGKTTGRFSVVVADIDSGVDYTHPELGLNIWTNPAEAGLNCSDGVDNDADGYVDDCRGWNFWSGTNDPMDDFGHGTHTSGTIGALTNNALGVAGANWDVQIMPLKFTDNQGNGTTALAVQALDYAVAHGATISNNSWGYYGGTGFDFALRDAIKRAGVAGHLFITAAGNGDGVTGTDDDSVPFYPCDFSKYDPVNNPDPPTNIICVAATDSNDGLAGFSNFGSTTVQLGAPGVGILSTYFDQTQGHIYAFASGTSQAAPHVAGGAALLKACNPSLSSAAIQNILLSTARPDVALTGKTTTGGVVNYQAALNDSRVGDCGPAPTGSAPVANAGGSYNSNFKKPIQFDGTGSSDAGGQLLLYFWDFGDGTYGVGPNPSHQYQSRGTFTATLTVRDNLGAEASQTATVNVRPTGQGNGVGPANGNGSH